MLPKPTLFPNVSAGPTSPPPPPPPVPPPAPAVNLVTSPNDFSNVAWTLSGVTVANPGAANQALMEVAANTDHYVTETINWGLGAVQARLQYDIIGNLGRPFTKFQVSNQDFSGGIAANYDGTTGAVTSRTTLGAGFVSNGVYSVFDMGGGTWRCTCDFIPTALQSAQLNIFVLICNPDTNEVYLGDITKGMRVRNVQVGAL